MHGIRIERKQAVSCGGIRDSGALTGERRVEDNLGSRASVVIVTLQLLQEGREISAESGKPFLSPVIPGFVEAIAGQNNIGLHLGEIVMDVAEIFRARAQADGVG